MNSNNIESNSSWAGALPVAQGLYNPENEKDSCGVGFIASIKGEYSHHILKDASNILCNMVSQNQTCPRVFVRFFSATITLFSSLLFTSSLDCSRVPPSPQFIDTISSFLLCLANTCLSFLIYSISISCSLISNNISFSSSATSDSSWRHQCRPKGR